MNSQRIALALVRLSEDTRHYLVFVGKDDQVVAIDAPARVVPLERLKSVLKLAGPVVFCSHEETDKVVRLTLRSDGLAPMEFSFPVLQGG